MKLIGKKYKAKLEIHTCNAALYYTLSKFVTCLILYLCVLRVDYQTARNGRILTIYWTDVYRLIDKG